MKEKFTSTIENKNFFSTAFALLFFSLFFITASHAQIVQVSGSPQSTTTTGTTLTITKPSGLAVNDVMIVNIVQSDNDGNTLSNASLGGWTVIDGRSVGSNFNDEWWGTVLYKVATSGDVAAANFAFTLDSDASNDGSAGTIMAFRNVNVTGGFNASGTANSGPFDVDPGTISTSNTNSVTATTTTTNTANAAVIMLAMVGDNISYSGWETATGPLALTELYEQPFNTTLDNGTAAAWAIKTTAGGTGAGSADLTGTARGGALLITLRCITPTITTTGTATAACVSGSSQTTSLAYTATTNSPVAYSIDWNTTANTAGLTDQVSTAHAFAGGAGTIPNIAIPASVPAGTYTGTMSVTRAAGCPATQAVSLTINGPVVNAGSALSAICQGGTSSTLGGTVSGTATGGIWSDGGVGGTFNPNATTLNATWTAPGAYSGTATLTLTSTGGSCGSTFASKNQVVNVPPTAAVAGSDDVFCISAFTLGANAAVVGTGAWTITSGPNTSTAQITGGLSNPTATFTPTAAGNYTLRWTISTGGCTPSFDEVVYTVNALPQVSAFSGNSICSGDIGLLTATLTGASPFSVTYNPGGVNEGGVTSGFPFNVTPNPGTPGPSNYTITLIVDNNGCQRTTGFTDATATITVNDEGTWVGNVDNNWFNGANWCGGNIPTASTNVAIASATNQPTINASGAVANNITINSGNTLTLTGSNTLTVSGNWVNNGTFTSNTGTTVNFDGSTQTVTGVTTFRNLTANSSNSLSLNSTTAVAGLLSVPATRTLIVNNITLTINSGAAGSVSGTVRNSGTITTTGTLTFSNGGSYEHNFTTTSGVIPASTWAAGSTCKIIGYTSFANNPAGGPDGDGGFGQAFANFTWNCPNQTAASQISLAAFLTTINGDFTMTSTGAAAAFVALGNNAAGNLTVGGNFSQTGGTFIVSQGSTRNMTVAGNFSLSGGTFNFSTSNTGGNTVNVNVGGDFTHSGGTLTESGGVTTTAIVFNKAGTQLYTSGGTLSQSVDFIVNSGSVLQMGTGANPSVISSGSTGFFTLSNNGTLSITSPLGITSSGANGNIQLSGTRTFNTGANYFYIGTATQNTGNGLPGTVNNLTIDNTGGSTGVTLTGSVIVNGVLNLADGLLTTNANTITIASAGSISNADANRYVNGRLAKAFTNTTPFTFHIGKGGNYRPAVFNYTSATSKTVTIEQFEAAFPVASPASVSVVSFGNRYWNVTQSATGTNFFLQLDGSGITPTGTVSMVRSENGGAATANAVTTPDYTNSISFSTTNTSSNFRLGETAIPLTINNVSVTSTKVYDGTTGAVLNTGSATLSGVISPDVVTLNSAGATGTYADKHVGTGKDVTASGFTLGGANGGAYSLPTPNQFPGLTADIIERAITVNAVTSTKIYDANTTSSGIPAYTLQPGDATATTPVQTFDNANAGIGKTLSASGLVINDGNSGNNYIISYAVNNTGVIDPLAVVVTPDAGQFKLFGAADPAFTYTASPSLFSPDVFTGDLNRNSGETPGTYAYTLGSLNAGSNYLLSIGGSNTFEIQPVSQSNADFRSKANGNFSAIATWEYDLGGGNWQNATQVPTDINSVSITHDVVLDQDYLVGTGKNLVLGTGAALTIQPSSTLSINGTADFDNKAVTIQSDATGTGSIGEIAGSLSNATNVTVERYIPNNGFRSWRLLSVPTFGSGQTIRQAWQEGNSNPLPLQNNLPNRGTQISGTGNVAAAQAAGFDSSATNASLLRWAGSAWTGVASTNQSINSFNAYFLFIRGERTIGVTGSASNTSATTLRTNGTVYTGDQVNNINANSFSLVPNVYPSSIDFTGLSRTGGVSNLFYVWDSKKLNGTSLGMYQTFSATNNFNCMISGGSYVAGEPNTIIESGQAFFVKTTSNAGTITLVESAKTSNTNGSLGFRPSTPASAMIKIDTRLIYNTNNNMADANVVVFDEAYSNDVDADDALKFSNSTENFGIQKGSSILAVEGRQPVIGGDTIQFRMWNMQRQSYKLELAATNMAAQGVSAILQDSYLQSNTTLDLSGTTQVNFTVDANAASSANNRFRIVFRQLAPVPVNFVSITGHRTAAGVKVDWKSASERGIKNYVVERSADGRNFTAVGTIAAASNNAIEISYNFTDATAPSTALLYRIKSEGINNEIRYSPVARINAGNMQAGFAVSPNPVENGIMNLQFKNQQAGKYSVRIISNAGATISINRVNHAGGNSSHTINLAETMARGTYNVEITAPDNTKTVQSLLVNKK